MLSLHTGYRIYDDLIEVMILKTGTIPNIWDLNGGME